MNRWIVNTINLLQCIDDTWKHGTFVMYLSQEAKIGDIVYLMAGYPSRLSRSFIIKDKAFTEMGVSEPGCILQFRSKLNIEELSYAAILKHGYDDFAFGTQVKVNDKLLRYLQKIDYEPDDVLNSGNKSTKSPTNNSSSISTVLVKKEPPIFNEVSSTKNRNRNDFAAKTINFKDEAAKNSDLGRAGEGEVIAYERQRLSKAGRMDLASKVTATRDTIGNTAKFDIHSFNTNGSNRYIEVKTTTGPYKTMFAISENEVAFSEAHANNYYIYRLYNFNSNDKTHEFYILKGKINRSLLNPTSYNYHF